MTEQLERIRAVIGMESPPIEYVIDRGGIGFFAASLMDPDPVYRDINAAHAIGLNDLASPPVFFGDATGLRNVVAGERLTMFWNDIPLPKGWFSMASGDSFEFFEPVRPGMSVYAIERFVDAYERSGRNGPLIFFSYEKLFRSSAGNPVLRRLIHCVARPGTRTTRHAPVRRASDTLPEGAIRLPPLTVGPVSVRYLAMFATATAEYVDIHYDADYARSLGLDGPIVQGLYKTALIGQMVAAFSGYAGSVRSLDVQHRRMDLADCTLTACGYIMPGTQMVTDGDVACRVWVENQHGAVTTEGTARLRLPEGSH